MRISRPMSFVLAALAALVALAGCAPRAGKPAPDLHVVREFPDQQLTGVAVSRKGRIFVCFPRWSDNVKHSVVELLPDGGTAAYPDEAWNAWDGRGDPQQHFICAQSVVVDDNDRLWVLDPASPKFEGVVRDGAKLVRVDLATGFVERVYPLDDDVAPEKSYLNDFRVDARARRAYITDSGLGALVVVDLDSGDARRVLDAHTSVLAEKHVVPVVGLRKLFQKKDGQPLKAHACGIALDRRRGRLYFHPLTGKHLYSVPTDLLNDFDTPRRMIADAVTDHGETDLSDGMICDRSGNVYLTAIEKDSVTVWSPDGTYRTVVKSLLLVWPDSLAWGPDGALYVTTSQIHLSARFQPEDIRVSPYRLWRIQEKKTGWW